MGRYIYDEFGNKLRFKGTPIHNSYSGAKQRCNYKEDKHYNNYGGRGIKFEWDSFYSFYIDMASTYFDGATIDRIDYNGNYNKDNCRWVTVEQQARNTRKNIHTEEDVLLIRKLYSTGNYTQKELAEIFKDSQGNISNIITNKTWVISSALEENTDD